MKSDKDLLSDDQDPSDAGPAELEEADDLEDEDESEEIHARDLWQILHFLRPYARPHHAQLYWLFSLLLFETILNFSFPLLTQYLVDEGLIRKDFNVVKWVLIYFGAAAVLGAVIGLVCDYLNAQIFSNMVVDIRQRLFDHMQTLSMPFFTRTQSGKVLSRFSGDMVALEETLVTMIPWAVVPLLEVIYSVVVMFIFNVWLGLIGSLVFPLLLLAPRFFAKRTFALSYDKRQREGEVLSAAQENVAAMTVVKAFGLQPSARAHFGILNSLWLAIAFRVHFLGALVERSSHTGVYFVHMLIFSLGSWWAYTEEITVGTLVAFEATFLSMGYALTYVTQYTPTLAHAAGSIHHLADLFNEKAQVVDAPGAIELPRMQKDIVFADVSFTYGDKGFQLSRLNVRIAKGTFCAFVGASGSGKSTVLSLLLRFYDPTEGAVLVDGRDLRQVTQESLRSQIGMVFQESFLFNASILENIRVGWAEATSEQVMEAARDAEIHDFIVSLPRGYHTIVGERGSQLSGGQRQRLAIARALVRDPAILVLDEATSALDYSTEAALNETMLKVAQNRTVITVTHRLSSVVNADHIVVLKEGRLVEEGRHAELLQKDGVYTDLWRRQHEGGGDQDDGE